MSQQADMHERNGINPTQNSLQGSFSEGHLHKDVILPYLVGIKCCGFYLYASPLIYTQEFAGGENRNSFGGFQNVNPGSFVNMDSDGNDSDGFSLPRFSSVNPAAGIGFKNFDQLNRRGTFNYLHENIDEETMRDPVLQRMPILKNISRRNLIPVIDFEEFNKSSQDDRYSS